jgi:hypothetical protein
VAEAKSNSAQQGLERLLARLARLVRPQPSGLVTGLTFDLVLLPQATVIDNALLRQQLVVLKRRVPRPHFTWCERASIVLLSWLALGWQRALFIVQPATVLRWHRQLFQWIWKRRSKPTGRPKISRETILLIHEMARDNRIWGAERIRGELLKLGVSVSKRTIRKYLRQVRSSSPHGQRWGTFLKNHLHQTWACDFVQTFDALFRPIFALVFVELGTRRVLQIGSPGSPAPRGRRSNYGTLRPTEPGHGS